MFDINKIIEEITLNGYAEFSYSLGGKEFSIYVSFIDLPYILVIPSDIKDDVILALEVSNIESNILLEVIDNGLKTAYNLTKNLVEFSAPVLIPLLPSFKYGPYFQQLSKECFELDKDDVNYRIDLQVLELLEKVRYKIKEDKGIDIDSKIFLNGYSSSGVFAQRFALLHPNIIDTLCIGGASGSIPFPTLELGYPLGISDYKQLTGNEFDLKSYSEIKHRYYVGSLECNRKSDTRFDEGGNYAPMHDMSYFERSVPKEIGIKQRMIFGKDLFLKSSKQIELMKNIGIDISQTIFEGRTHNNINGMGVNELGDSFIKNCYEETL